MESLTITFNVRIHKRLDNAVSHKTRFKNNYSAVFRPSRIGRNVNPEVADGLGKGQPDTV